MSTATRPTGVARTSPTHASTRDGGACWCGATAWRTAFRTTRFGLIRCAACATYRLDPAPLEDGGVEDFYTDFYAEQTEAARAATTDAGPSSGRFWRVARQVAALGVPPSLHAVALDVGCGEGRLCGELLAAGWGRVVGVDLARSRLARARAAHPGAEFYPSLDAAPLAGASSDLIVLDNVIEHLHAPLAVVRGLAPYLRPSGALVLITPNMTSGHFRLLGRRWTPELCPDQHVYLFTPASIAALVTRAGLTVAHAGTIQTPAYPRRAWMAHVRGGEARELAWRAAQECGTWLSRATGAGGMLYVVARVAP